MLCVLVKHTSFYVHMPGIVDQCLMCLTEGGGAGGPPEVCVQ